MNNPPVIATGYNRGHNGAPNRAHGHGVGTVGVAGPDSGKKRTRTCSNLSSSLHPTELPPTSSTQNPSSWRSTGWKPLSYPSRSLFLPPPPPPRKTHWNGCDVPIGTSYNEYFPLHPDVLLATIRELLLLDGTLDKRTLHVVTVASAPPTDRKGAAAGGRGKKAARAAAGRRSSTNGKKKRARSRGKVGPSPLVGNYVRHVSQGCGNGDDGADHHEDDSSSRSAQKNENDKKRVVAVAVPIDHDPSDGGETNDKKCKVSADYSLGGHAETVTSEESNLAASSTSSRSRDSAAPSYSASEVVVAPKTNNSKNGRTRHILGHHSSAEFVADAILKRALPIAPHGDGSDNPDHEADNLRDEESGRTNKKGKREEHHHRDDLTILPRKVSDASDDGADDVNNNRHCGDRGGAPALTASTEQLLVPPPAMTMTMPPQIAAVVASNGAPGAVARASDSSCFGSNLVPMEGRLDAFAMATAEDYPTGTTAPQRQQQTAPPALHQRNPTQLPPLLDVSIGLESQLRSVARTLVRRMTRTFADRPLREFLGYKSSSVQREYALVTMADYLFDVSHAMFAWEEEEETEVERLLSEHPSLVHGGGRKRDNDLLDLAVETTVRDTLFDARALKKIGGFEPASLLPHALSIRRCRANGLSWVDFARTAAGKKMLRHHRHPPGEGSGSNSSATAEAALAVGKARRAGSRQHHRPRRRGQDMVGKGGRRRRACSDDGTTTAESLSSSSSRSRSSSMASDDSGSGLNSNQATAVAAVPSTNGTAGPQPPTMERSRGRSHNEGGAGRAEGIATAAIVPSAVDRDESHLSGSGGGSAASFDSMPDLIRLTVARSAGTSWGVTLAKEGCMCVVAHVQDQHSGKDSINGGSEGGDEALLRGDMIHSMENERKESFRPPSSTARRLGLLQSKHSGSDLRQQQQRGGGQNQSRSSRGWFRDAVDMFKTSTVLHLEVQRVKALGSSG